MHKAALARKRAEAARARGESVVQSSPIGCALSTLDLQGLDGYSTCAL